MVKSLKAELEDIERLEKRAMEDLERAKAKREKVVGPTRSRILGVFGERLDLYLRQDLARLSSLGMRFDRPAFSEVCDVFIEGFFGARSGSEAPGGGQEKTKEESPPSPFEEEERLYLDGSEQGGVEGAVGSGGRRKAPKARLEQGN